MTPDIVQAAAALASCKHVNQKYGSELPYTKHLKDVVEVLKRMKVADEEMLAAAWLHDVVEVTDVTVEQLRLIFGNRVAELVHCVTNEPGKNRKERHAATYGKIKANGDALQLKLADRIANVEHSIMEVDKDKMKMYKGEHENFKAVLYTAGQHEAMWRHLNFLIGET